MRDGNPEIVGIFPCCVLLSFSAFLVEQGFSSYFNTWNYITLDWVVFCHLAVTAASFLQLVAVCLKYTIFLLLFHVFKI